MIGIRHFSALPFSEREALRYLGYRGVQADGETLSALESVRAEAERALLPAVCWTETDVVRSGNALTVGTVTTESGGLRRNLRSCARAYVFAATVGVGIDRLLVRYGRTDALKCALLQAVGATYVEALCDAFCDWLAERTDGYLRPRFSPGYGDLSLETQRDIFRLLTPEKRIGVTLNASLLMSPSKSVTAIVGISPTPCSVAKRCADCENATCEYRDEL